MEGAAVEIPSYFLCPISLELMRDPVTLSTGITYDRDSIERWVYVERRGVCPVTKQTLGADAELTPNHTLRRLIQAWCTVNSSTAGVERFPTPKPPVDRAQVVGILEDARVPQSQLPALRRLKAVVAESERNRRCVEATPGALELLFTVIASYGSGAREEEAADGFLPSCSGAGACDEALDILSHLQVSEEGLVRIVSTHARIIDSLTTILQRSSYKSRANATLILKYLVEAMCASPDTLVGLSKEFYHEVLSVLRDRITVKATKAALHVLIAVCPWGKNRISAVEAGAVPAMVELLLEDPERRVSELALGALHLFCGYAEGRAELVGHAAGVSVVSKKILRVSHLASETALRILHSLARRTATPALLREMAQVGVVAKLCLVLQADCTVKTKEKAREILRMHSTVWKRSPCLSSEFKLSYPSS